MSRLKDRTDFKEENRRIFGCKTQELSKEYARTQEFNQETEPVSHGH
jgi:hypothetical protein